MADNDDPGHAFSGQHFVVSTGFVARPSSFQAFSTLRTNYGHAHAGERLIGPPRNTICITAALVEILAITRACGFMPSPRVVLPRLPLRTALCHD